MRLFLSGCVFLLAMLLLYPAQGEAQQCAGGRVEGTLFDPSRAAVANAEVSLQAPSALPVRVRSDEQGRFVFRCVPAARYAVQVRAPGFRSPLTHVQVHAGASEHVDLHLALAAVETTIEVGEDATSLDTDHGAGTHTLTGKDVQELADDPDDLKRQLQVLAAASGGAPGQAIITVDGFLNASQLPPKSSIASIRVNPDMFSSEYEEPPYRGGRIEIYTKPGLDLLHGAVFYTDSDPSLNANDPYSVTGTPAAKRRYGFELSGPIVRRKSDFALALEKRDIDEFNVVNALVLSPAGTPAALHQSVPAPQQLWIASARGDWQWSPRNVATATYSINLSSVANQGVGGLSLQESGFSTTASEQDLRLTNIATLSPSLLHQTRIGYTWKDTSETPNSSAPSLQVAGAFIGGGATSQALNDRERDLEVDDDLLRTRGAHTIKLGVEALGIFVHATDPDTFNGAFLFGGGIVAPNLNASGTGVIDGLEQYRRTLAGLPGGTPTTYQLTSGNALVPFTQWRLAMYAQDTFKLSARLTLSAGLRYALETSPSSFANFAPRLGLAWSPDKKQKWVIHLRAGLFSSPVTQATSLDAYRLNGSRQVEQLIYAPSYRSPRTPVDGSLSVATVHSFAAHAGETPSAQAQAGLERDLPHHWHVQGNVFYAESWDSLRSRNINAPLPAAATADPLHAPRPGPANTNIFEYQQTGNLHGTVTFVGVDQHSYKRFGVFVGYLHFHLLTDADTSGQFPQSSYSDHGEMARASWESTHRIFAIGQINLPYKASFSTQFDAASGVPYNVITGTDNNGDGVFNDRPSFASAAGEGVYATRFGLLSSTAANGTLPRNTGTLPSNVHLDVDLSRAFAVGKGTGDRHPSVTLNARSANLLNHTNVVAVGTVLGSPTFSQPLAAETARRLELGARFTF